MRFSLVCLLAMLVAGCSSALPPAELPPPQLALAGAATTLPRPELLDDRLIAADGAVLPLQHWLPPGEPTAVVLALHGFNDYSNAFAIPARLWTKSGIATYAYDQRGFGRAPGRGRWFGGRQLVSDAVTALRLLHRRYPGTPVYLLGESMGGAIAILAASGRTGIAAPAVDGVILVAPAVWGRQTMSVFERAGLWLADLLPRVRWSASVLPIHIHPSDNLPMLRAYSADPLVIKQTRADTINGLVDLMSAALSAAPALDSRLFLLYGDRDEIVPRAAVARFVATLPGRDRERQRIALYPQGYHMLLRDLHGGTPAADIAAWVGVPAAPLPSGLDDQARARLIGRPKPVEAALQ
ncbi:MAG TPA: lysophospholipase [Stellaceae bacterium]|nr:lysophospholipase [Stellaceae bacterium]